MQEEPYEQSELFEHHRILVDRGQAMLRIDKFLGNRLEDVSRNKLQQAAKAGNILVNGTTVKPNYKVKPADVISIVLPYPHHEFELIPEEIPLKILYEDESIVVVNKEAGMVVHPGHGNYTGTLVNALAWHLKEIPLFKSGEMRPGLVHRIDKDTSGILVIAKNEIALNRLARQFFDRTTQRTYIALVWGHFDNEAGTIEGNIGRCIKDRMKMQVFPEGNQGKSAITHYRVIENLGYVTLLECRLETGRTHQIRVHMEYTGHPVFNDERYGGDKIVRGTTFSKYRQFVKNCFTIMPRHALHAKSLVFVHPETGNSMSFDSELPDDFQQVLEKWRGYRKSEQ
ncbi:MAG: RluA family pseudouridine synthase [Bacteroidales bacterium]|nr:RluA family pseudouridine synthase [Bacteroidales bacterium]